MRAVYRVEDIRAAENALMQHVPSGALMQRAATAVARRGAQLLGRCYGSRVVLLVGKGNNGGDALFAGAQLAQRGARVTAILSGAAHAAGLAAFQRAGGDVGDESALPTADLVIDGLLGIGGRGGLRDEAARLATQLDDLDVPVLAVDVPSGVDADSGNVDGSAIAADVTVTFGALKAGLVVSPGSWHAGVVELIDIGLQPFLPAANTEVLDAEDVAALLPVAAGETSKYERGVVGIVAGSERYTGAAVLAAGGALRAGAGMVRFAGVPHAAERVRARWPEVVVTDVSAGDDGEVCDPDEILQVGRVDAWVIGPGMGTGKAANSVVEALLQTDVPVLVDADGLTILANRHEWLRRRNAPTVLTPHIREFTRLTGQDETSVEADRLAAARTAAAALHATVLLKGSATVIANPDGEARINSTGTPALATAGSGDVLSGACGALLAAGVPALAAAAAGAFLHGLSGLLATRGTTPITAGDLLASWSDAERAVRAQE